MKSKERSVAASRALAIGIALLLLGGLLWTYAGSTQRPIAAASVSVRAVGPEGELLFFVDPVRLPQEQATVLQALLVAASRSNVSVDVNDSPGLGAFVVSIGGHRNEGACGWVWDRNGVRGDRASDRAGLRDGDAVLWHWDCET